MVRRPPLAWSLAALALTLTAPTAADAAPAPSAVSARPRQSPAEPAPKASSPAGRPAPKLDWRARVAVEIEALQQREPAQLDKLMALQPDRAVEDALFFSQPEASDRRAAPVFLRRLLAGTESVKVRRALAEALPQTGGDWQEAAAALIAVDASPVVRKQLVETMRYAGPPHSVEGLRRGFKDEAPEVKVAAARAAGFSRSGADLFEELYSSTFDVDPDLRAAAVQAFGMLRLPSSRDVLIKALSDDDREVRLQALLSLEQIDPEGLLHLPQLEALAKDRKSHRISRKATQLLRKKQRLEQADKRVAKRRHASAASGSIPRTP
jgi:HEAT repeat protein